MNKDFQYWIRKLALDAHPEGGYYRQTYRAGLVLPKQESGETLQAVVKAGCWFASEVLAQEVSEKDAAFALVGCTIRNIGE